MVVMLNKLHPALQGQAMYSLLFRAGQEVQQLPTNHVTHSTTRQSARCCLACRYNPSASSPVTSFAAYHADHGCTGGLPRLYCCCVYEGYYSVACVGEWGDEKPTANGKTSKKNIANETP